ncbi:MAG: hypothetical protein DWQ37_01595 [Planctomycetota bacterium]|nr:MAG: hypothetical protein DWQ37_01595 [Planctomycetota bacterium]
MSDLRARSISRGRSAKVRCSRGYPRFEELESRRLLTAVAGREIFYNNSKFDGFTPGVSASDDGAIAFNKSPYQRGDGPAAFDNITSFSRGINGLMIDVDDLQSPISTDDFQFYVSTSLGDTSPDTWVAAPQPSSISIRPGAGVLGSDRIGLVWPDGAIANRWLRVIFEGNDATGGFNTNTGLSESDEFFFGNRIGDDGSGSPTVFITSATDEIAARANPGFGVGVNNPWDYDRSGVVNAVDQIVARNNGGVLTKINLADAPALELTSLVPFTIDLTPQLTVTAESSATLPDGTVVSIDVDLNNDGDYADLGETNYTQSTLFASASTFSLDHDLPANPTQYDITLRARVVGSDGQESISPDLALEVDTRTSTALADYVAAADASYHYTVAKTVVGAGYTFYVLDMTSQTWRSSADVDKPDWRHWVEVVVPNGALSETALLYITGGNNSFGSAPNSPNSDMRDLALATGTVTVRLRTVPSQPLEFVGDDYGPRSEDEIIAYSFDRFLSGIGDPGNETWPVLVAMAKSAVRAMDSVQDFIPTVRPTEQIDDFVVTGYSKRGWTTWLTAAVDDRVRAIIPGVIDVLNQGPQMVHHYNVYGFFSPAVHDYEDEQIFSRILTPEAQELSQIVDPYRYLNNGMFDDMPKLLINSAGDEFFVSDSAQYYFDDIPGTENYLRYLPNTGHGLDGRAGESTYGFYEAILNNRTLPEFSWTVAQDGEIQVTATTAPLSVRLWQATNNSARDFRRAYNPGITWTSSILADQGGGTYVGDVPMPGSGATGYFVELTFDHPAPGVPDYVFTTEIRVKSNLPLYPWPYGSGPPAPASAEPLALSGDEEEAVALALAAPAATTSASSSAVPLVESAESAPASSAAVALAVDLAWAEDLADKELASDDAVDALLLLLDEDWA